MAKTVTLETLEAQSASYAFVPTKPPQLAAVAAAASACTACPLYANATQTVFGEGPAHAQLMLVGEQPGDKEDVQGKPFVGPAGQLLNKALEDAGIDRTDVYLTNVVKHFYFEPPAARGKPRIHKKPLSSHVKACRAWFIEEVKLVKPQVLVCLGATAAQSLYGATFRITESRGQWLPASIWAPQVLATYHPSALLRAPDAAARMRMMNEFVADLKTAAAGIKGKRRGGSSPVR